MCVCGSRERSRRHGRGGAEWSRAVGPETPGEGGRNTSRPVSDSIVIFTAKARFREWCEWANEGYSQGDRKPPRRSGAEAAGRLGRRAKSGACGRDSTQRQTARIFSSLSSANTPEAATGPKGKAKKRPAGRGQLRRPRPRPGSPSDGAARPRLRSRGPRGPKGTAKKRPAGRGPLRRPRPRQVTGPRGPGCGHGGRRAAD